MGLKRFIKELKRRNVIKAALAYLVFAWIVIQVFSTFLPTFGAPEYIMKMIWLVTIILFPLWIIFSWVYEITPDGIKMTRAIDPEKSITGKTSNRLNFIIIGGLVVVIFLLALNLFADKASTDNQPINSSQDSLDVADKSIAVLAFADLSPNKDQEYFSDGISEELLNLLAKISDLRVISRTSSFSYKGTDKTIETIGKELNVNHVLEGSVRKAGDQLRITAQLIDVSSGAHIWSETYDRELDDIFKIQDEIAGRVADRLRVTILGQEKQGHVTNKEAYNYYLRALEIYPQRNLEAMKEAYDLIHNSIEYDSLYAPSWLLLSRINYALSMSLNYDFDKYYEEYKVAIARAVELDPDDANVLIHLARYNYTSEDDFLKAEENLRKALELQSGGNSTFFMDAAHMLSILGDPEDSYPLYEKAIILDPLNYNIYFNKSLVYHRSFEYQKSLDELDIYQEKMPDSDTYHSLVSDNLLFLNQVDSAYYHAQRETTPFWKKRGLIMCLDAMGRQKESDLILEELISEFRSGGQSNFAEIYAMRKDYNQAFKWLEAAIDEGDSGIITVLSNPTYQNLYSDPRWEEILIRLNFPKDHRLRKLAAEARKSI